MRHVENKKLPVSLAREDLRDLSDVHSGLYNDVMSFHHVTKSQLLGVLFRHGSVLSTCLGHEIKGLSGRQHHSSSEQWISVRRYLLQLPA